MQSPLQQLIERCRRQQQQKPGQLEMPSEREEQLMAVNRDMTNFMAELTLGDIEEEEMWQEHTRERIAQMEEEWNMRSWATEDEALEEWRSRTLEDWGFGRWYDEDAVLA